MHLTESCQFGNISCILSLYHGVLLGGVAGAIEINCCVPVVGSDAKVASMYKSIMYSVTLVIEAYG